MGFDRSECCPGFAGIHANKVLKSWLTFSELFLKAMVFRTWKNMCSYYFILRILQNHCASVDQKWTGSRSRIPQSGHVTSCIYNIYYIYICYIFYIIYYILYIIYYIHVISMFVDPLQPRDSQMAHPAAPAAPAAPCASCSLAPSPGTARHETSNKSAW